MTQQHIFLFSQEKVEFRRDVSITAALSFVILGGFTAVDLYYVLATINHYYNLVFNNPRTLTWTTKP